MLLLILLNFCTAIVLLHQLLPLSLRANNFDCCFIRFRVHINICHNMLVVLTVIMVNLLRQVVQWIESGATQTDNNSVAHASLRPHQILLLLFKLRKFLLVLSRLGTHSDQITLQSFLTTGLTQFFLKVWVSISSCRLLLLVLQIFCLTKLCFVYWFNDIGIPLLTDSHLLRHLISLHAEFCQFLDILDLGLGDLLLIIPTPLRLLCKANLWILLLFSGYSLRAFLLIRLCIHYRTFLFLSEANVGLRNSLFHLGTLQLFDHLNMLLFKSLSLSGLNLIPFFINFRTTFTIFGDFQDL